MKKRPGSLTPWQTSQGSRPQKPPGSRTGLLEGIQGSTFPEGSIAAQTLHLERFSSVLFASASGGLPGFVVCCFLKCCITYGKASGCRVGVQTLLPACSDALNLSPHTSLQLGRRFSKQRSASPGPRPQCGAGRTPAGQRSRCGSGARAGRREACRLHPVQGGRDGLHSHGSVPLNAAFDTAIQSIQL